MGDFFHGWRRKIGVMTLVMALVAMGGWVWSFEGFNKFTIQPSPDIRDSFASTHGSLWWGRIHRGDYVEFIQDPFSHIYSLDRRYKIRWQWLGFDVYEMQDNGDGLRNKVVQIPYWSIVIPLTLLSAYLLLSRLRSPAQRKITEPSVVNEARVMKENFMCLKIKSGMATNLLAMMIISAIVIVVIRSPVQWASDGSILIPVKIFVFDAANRRPIPNAECLVFHSPPVYDASSLTDDRINFKIQSKNEWLKSDSGTTDAIGTVVIEKLFLTSANNEHPSPHAHLMYVSVQVEAEGYGGVVVPLGYGEIRTSEIRKAGEIVISIGLIPAKAIVDIQSADPKE